MKTVSSLTPMSLLVSTALISCAPTQTAPQQSVVKAPPAIEYGYFSQTVITPGEFGRPNQMGFMWLTSNSRGDIGVQLFKIDDLRKSHSLREQDVCDKIRPGRVCENHSKMVDALFDKNAGGWQIELDSISKYTYAGKEYQWMIFTRTKN